MILIPEVFALRINEFESNPPGTDSGAEWVELYSEESVNLDGYILENGDKSYNLSGTFVGYLTIIFPGSWLVNKNETVLLKQVNNIISQAGPFNDLKNNEKTWSFCDEWRFISGTQNAVNACDGGTQLSVQEPENDTNENSGLSYLTNEDSGGSESVLPTVQEDLPNVVAGDTNIADNKPKKITLNSPKQEYEKTVVTKTYKTRVGVIYAFLGICVFLVVLIAWRKL